MTTGTCTNCGREANDLKKCTGACGGEDMYCNTQCQRYVSISFSLYIMERICIQNDYCCMHLYQERSNDVFDISWRVYIM